MLFDACTVRMLSSIDFDIDEKEMILCYRRKHIERKLVQVSAKEMVRIIPSLVRERCEGCITGHLSQTHHTCLTTGKFKQLEYFDAALERASEAVVMKTFTESLRAVDLDVLNQYPLEDWKTVFCAKHQQALKQEILKLL